MKWKSRWLFLLTKIPHRMGTHFIHFNCEQLYQIVTRFWPIQERHNTSNLSVRNVEMCRVVDYVIQAQLEIEYQLQTTLQAKRKLCNAKVRRDRMDFDSSWNLRNANLSGFTISLYPSLPYSCYYSRLLSVNTSMKEKRNRRKLSLDKAIFQQGRDVVTWNIECRSLLKVTQWQWSRCMTLVTMCQWSTWTGIPSSYSI